MRIAAALYLCAGWVACASPGDPMDYRLAGVGSHWADASGGRLVAELRGVYPDYFDRVLDPSDTRDLDLRPLRGDLEQEPVDRRNFDALNAIAIGYFEINYRAETAVEGSFYLGNSFRAAHLLAVPWRAYGEVRDPRLRESILDFFEDAGSGDKLGSASTAPRLARIVASLEPKENDPARRARIERLARRLQAVEVPVLREPAAGETRP
jgi:hypothetical protein